MYRTVKSTLRLFFHLTEFYRQDVCYTGARWSQALLQQLKFFSDPRVRALQAPHDRAPHRTDLLVLDCGTVCVCLFQQTEGFTSNV